MRVHRRWALARAPRATSVLQLSQLLVHRLQVRQLVLLLEAPRSRSRTCLARLRSHRPMVRCQARCALLAHLRYRTDDSQSLVRSLSLVSLVAAYHSPPAPPPSFLLVSAQRQYSSRRLRSPPFRRVVSIRFQHRLQGALGMFSPPTAPWTHLISLTTSQSRSPRASAQPVLRLPFPLGGDPRIVGRWQHRCIARVGNLSCRQLSRIDKLSPRHRMHSLRYGLQASCLRRAADQGCRWTGTPPVVGQRALQVSWTSCAWRNEHLLRGCLGVSTRSRALGHRVYPRLLP